MGKGKAPKKAKPAKKAAKRTTASTSNEKAGWQDSYITLCDIVDFSEMRQGPQVKSVKHLTTAAKKTAFVKTLSSTNHRFICIGDGFILVVSGKKTYAEPSALLAFVHELQDAVRAYNKNAKDKYRYEFRAGIHAGDSKYIKIFEFKNAIGNGVNMSARVSNVGDAWHVLISKDFEKRLAREQADHDEVTQPHSGTTPYVRDALGPKVIKHNEQIELFNVYQEDGGAITFGNKSTPKSYGREGWISDLVFGWLKSVHPWIEAKLASISGKSADEIGLRLSILMPNKERDHLIVSKYRFAKDGIQQDPSEAMFPITAGKVYELAGLCYEKTAPQCVFGLPDRESNEPGYIAGLNAAECKITDAAQIRRWRRPARAFFQLPVPLKYDKTTAVLAADCANGLDKLTKNDIIMLHSELYEALPTLAILLQVK